jgi:hypothetical protein
MNVRIACIGLAALLIAATGGTPAPIVWNTKPVPLKTQSFSYNMKDGVPTDASDWVHHVVVTVSGTVALSRAWTSGQYCVSITRNTDVSFYDTSGAKVPIPSGYTAGAGYGWSSKAFYDKPEVVGDSCFPSGDIAPCNAHHVTKLEGYYSWYKSPNHTFVWNLNLLIPKLVVGPYAKHCIPNERDVVEGLDW